MNHENCLHFLIAKAHQKISGIFRSGLQRMGLTPAQALVLVVLYEEEGISAGDLGMRLVLDSPTISGLLDRMEKDNWIIKKNSQNDGRLLEITLTEKAHKIKDQLLSEIEVSNEKVLSIFKIEERILFERFLRDLRK
ncbi:MAG: MarR family transcriptional regulator [Deltaproteobacteria bacterium]|nr:MarR family transcriptional regulator [Deltaproteobacteria bacterium]